jgi:MFS family permease
MMAAPAPSKRAYYHLFAAQALALVSTGLATVALALLAYKLAGADAGAVMGTALAIKMGTYVLLAPFAAAVAERLPRRALLIGLDLARAAIALLLPLVTKVWEVYALIFLFQAASAIFTPTYQALVPEFWPDEAGYTRALARSRLVYDLEGVVSPALAAALLTLVSFRGVFAGTCVGFLLSAALILRVTLPERRPRDRAIEERALSGFRIFLATPRLRALMVLNVAAAAAAAMVTVNTVVIAQGRFGLGERAVALALVTYGGGSMLGALGLPLLLGRITDRMAMLGGAALLALCLGIGAFLPSHVVMLALWFGLGLGGALAQVPAGGLLRRSAPPDDRQSLYAAQFALSHAALLVTYPMAGSLGAAAGMPATFAAFAAIAALSLLAGLALWPRADRAAVQAVGDRRLRADDPT